MAAKSQAQSRFSVNTADVLVSQYRKKTKKKVKKA